MVKVGSAGLNFTDDSLTPRTVITSLAGNTAHVIPLQSVELFDSFARSVAVSSFAEKLPRCGATFFSAGLRASEGSAVTSISVVTDASVAVVFRLSRGLIVIL
jgi:hypothetical protein